jgi:hypothetical protein
MSNRNLNTQQYDPASVISAWSVVNPDSLLDRITPQLQKELLESALSQLKDGLGDLASLYDLAPTSEEYDGFIRGAHRLLAESENPVDMLNRLHRVLVYSISAGWICCLSGVYSRLMETINWTSTHPDQGGTKPRAGTDNGDSREVQL